MSRFFDYIIVGAGSAGCVLANRLSADRSARVALIEAGGSNRSPVISMPAATDFYGIGNPLYDWRYHTAPDASRKNRTEIWPRGRGLGGSSAINGLVYMQGLPSDFSAWEQAGANGWSWDDVQAAYSAIHDQGDGTGGLVVNDLQEVHPTTELFLASGEAAGLKRSDRLSSDPDPGVGYVQATYKRGRRISNAAAFLSPVCHRQNLTVFTHTKATRVLFEGRKAVGVTCQRWGRSFNIRAGHIILTAGTIASPQLLLVSGIGPAEDLRRLGIRVVADRPGVGANLQEHAGAYLSYRVDLPTLNSELGWGRRFRHGIDWLWRGRGVATTPGGQALAYLRTRPEAETPDVQVQFTPIGYSLVDGHLSVPKTPSVTAVVSVNRPFSRGRVSVTSGDIRVPPWIEPRLFADERDLVTLREGTRAAADFMRRGPLGNALGQAMPVTPDTDADDGILAESVRAIAGTNFHPVGTCRIGGGDDRHAVVNQCLQVHGIEGLTVADAAVMPFIVSANINATVTMIAERAAHFVL